jgi:3'-phosphoadenosine 5'-phosphosulfate sulfotransferase (PAPS reductase)/FAD synthetase
MEVHTPVHPGWIGPTMIRNVCMFSGGVTSWAAAKRVVEQEGPEGTVLLFSDTLIEDEDLYRFLEEGAANIGVPLTRIQDGRTPWEVFRDVRYLGNTRVDPCSRVLKRRLMDQWVKENAPDAVTVVGLAFDEPERIERFQARMAQKGRKVRAPLAEKPWISSQMAREWAEREGLRVPRLYKMGFVHNNCGGFCVKAGHGSFANLLQHFPERYLEHERKEEEFRQFLGRDDVTILRDRRGGRTRPMTLREFRERIQGGGSYDQHDHGGCGCAIDDGDEGEVGTEPG